MFRIVPGNQTFVHVASREIIAFRVLLVLTGRSLLGLNVTPIDQMFSLNLCYYPLITWNNKR